MTKNYCNREISPGENLFYINISDEHIYQYKTWVPTKLLPSFCQQKVSFKVSFNFKSYKSTSETLCWQGDIMGVLFLLTSLLNPAAPVQPFWRPRYRLDEWRNSFLKSFLFPHWHSWGDWEEHWGTETSNQLNQLLELEKLQHWVILDDGINKSSNTSPFSTL